MGKMKAAVYRRTNEIDVVSMDIPKIGPRDVLLKVKAVGICGSDLHTFKAGLYSYPNQIMGHEFCGEIVGIGELVEGLVMGDRVTGFTVSYCGKCFWCKQKKFRLCPSLFDHFSGYGKPGAMAEYMKIENAVLNENVFKVPDHLSDVVAATAEPLGTAIYAMYRAKPATGDQVIIIGAGMIGNLIAQVMKTCSVSKVIVIEPSKSRLSLSKELGADIIINPLEKENLLSVVQHHTGVGGHHFGQGGMADIVIDAAGVPSTVNQAIEFVRSNGTVGLVGLSENLAPVDISKVIHKDIEIVGIFGSVISKGLEYLSQGLIKTEPLITHRFSLDDIDLAFHTASNDPQAMKVMVIP